MPLTLLGKNVRRRHDWSKRDEKKTIIELARTVDDTSSGGDPAS
jgi:hypothetical protein